jgi:uncharacterized LabA/DUF88 family protein
MTTALFVDVGNVYYCIGKRFGERKLDYQKLYERACRIAGGPLRRATAYASQVTNEAELFFSCLEKIGFETKWKRPQLGKQKTVIRKADWDVGICIDVVRIVPRIDTVILCSSDSDLVPLIQWVHEQGVKCIVLACGVSNEIKEVATRTFEITEDLLEDKIGAKAA